MFTSFYPLFNANAFQSTSNLITYGVMLLASMSISAFATHATVRSVLWAGKPVITFDETSLIYSVNLKSLISTPYKEITGFEIRKYVGRGTIIRVLVIRKSDLTMDKIGLNRLDVSINKLESQFNQKLIPHLENPAT